MKYHSITLSVACLALDTPLFVEMNAIPINSARLPRLLVVYFWGAVACFHSLVNH